MKWLAVVLGVFLLAARVSGQPAPRLCWDHDGLSLSRFEVSVDSATPVSVGKPTPVGLQYCTPLPALTAGTHTITVWSCYDNGTPATTADDVCVVSPSLTVVKL